MDVARSLGQQPTRHSWGRRDDRPTATDAAQTLGSSHPPAVPRLRDALARWRGWRGSGGGNHRARGSRLTQALASPRQLGRKCGRRLSITCLFSPKYWLETGDFLCFLQHSSFVPQSSKNSLSRSHSIADLLSLLDQRMPSTNVWPPFGFLDNPASSRSFHADHLFS